MEKELVAHCEIVNGTFKWKNPEYLMQGLLKFNNCQGLLTIKRKWNKRSLSQNALYWLWLGVASKDIGYTENELHTIFKGLFAPKKEIKIGVKLYMIPKSTTDLSKGEMVEYMFNVETQLNQLGITLPHPEDLQMPKLINEK